MELVRLDGYTEDEKVVIARDHLLPRQLERAGLESDEVALEESALRKLSRRVHSARRAYGIWSGRSPGCSARSRPSTNWATGSRRSR